MKNLCTFDKHTLGCLSLEPPKQDKFSPGGNDSKFDILTGHREFVNLREQ